MRATIWLTSQLSEVNIIWTIPVPNAFALGINNVCESTVAISISCQKGGKNQLHSLNPLFNSITLTQSANAQ